MLSRFLTGRLLARERLRFILMTPHEFRRLLGMPIFDLPPLRSGTLGRGALSLFFLQMLTLKILRLRVMLLLKLPQLVRTIALGPLLLLDAIALEFL